MNILIVEDDPAIAKLIRELLVLHGHRCFIASTAEEAERVVETYPIDGCTLDLGLPGKPGLEWLEQLAVRRPTLARRTLVITGSHLTQAERRKIEKLGAGLMGKPIPLKALANCFVEPAPH